MPSFAIPLSGLSASSLALSSIANNLANLNTVGYKDSGVEFKDLFYQNLGTSGSGDPIQFGAGVAVGAQSTQFTPGSVSTTGVQTDVAIQGDGFFVVQGANGADSYTRAGNFSLDKNGYLVTTNGQTVLGYTAASGVINPAAGLSGVQLGNNNISPPTATTTVETHTNLNANAQVGDTFSSPITVYDTLGGSHVLTFTYTNTGTSAWTYKITIPAADVGATGAPVSVSNGTLAFDTSGQLTTPSANVTGIPITGFADGAANLSFTWKLFDGGSTLTQLAAQSNTSATTQDGNSSGTLLNFSIGSDGLITGAFSNGRTSLLGQVAVASFANPQGLSRVGGNDFTSTLASGQAAIGTPGTSGRGTLAGGALELSNVDIAQEFSKLIVAQRSFEANARTVTTFDQITQDTIDLKR